MIKIDIKHTDLLRMSARILTIANSLMYNGIYNDKIFFVQRTNDKDLTCCIILDAHYVEGECLKFNYY